ncbi:putative membrane protein [Yersinia aldovae 670-83]|nr:putative membrane protein [Yersinia aldovae 670-83]
MNFRNKVFLLWGIMDTYYILRFIYVSVFDGRIPIYSDIKNFIFLGGDEHIEYIIFFSCSMLLTLSTIVTAYLFLKKSKYAITVAWIQEPFRLFLVVPSISLIPTFLSITGLQIIVLNVFLLLSSEFLKCYTLLKARKL